MKKAFNLSELLVTIMVVGILSALLVPTVMKVNPNRDRVMYKKAMYNLTTAINKVFENNYADMGAAGDLSGFSSQTEFCNKVFAALNTKGANNCSNTSSSFASPNFYTLDGLKYWGVSGAFSSGTKVIHVDFIGTANTAMNNRDKAARSANKGPMNGSTPYGLKIKINTDGKVFIDAPSGTSGTDSNYYYEDFLLNEDNKLY